MRDRMRFWAPVSACWGAALGALYVHPGLWALFGVLLVVSVVWNVRAWSREGVEP